MEQTAVARRCIWVQLRPVMLKGPMAQGYRTNLWTTHETVFDIHATPMGRRWNTCVMINPPAFAGVYPSAPGFSRDVSIMNNRPVNSSRADVSMSPCRISVGVWMVRSSMRKSVSDITLYSCESTLIEQRSRNIRHHKSRVSFETVFLGTPKKS